MALERTFSIIKPDATRRNITGKIIAKIEEAGLRVLDHLELGVGIIHAELVECSLPSLLDRPTCRLHPFHRSVVTSCACGLGAGR